MALRKPVLTLALVAALVGAAVQPSKATPTTVGTTALPVGNSAAGAGVWAAGGIVGVAAVLCLYDLWLKFNGFKNWDGTPKVTHVVHHHR